MEFHRTDGNDKDFIENCRLLDMVLDRRVGKEIKRDKYKKYNRLDKIQEAIVVYEDSNAIGGGAWEVLDDSEKYQLLYNQLEVYDLDELANRFGELGGVYEQFAERSRHKYTLFANEYNEKLCQKLYERGFVSSNDIINEKIGFDSNTSMDIREKRITGFVRKRW